MSSTVLSSLVPVVLLIAIGFVAGHAGWIRPAATKDLSNLVFMVLTPALLFRSMSSVRLDQLNFEPVLVYLAGATLLYAIVLVWHGVSRRAAVLALASTYSNNVMIGVPLVGLAYGQAGLVILLTLISVHSLVLLTLATVVLEIAVAREQAGTHPAARGDRWRTVLGALRSGIVHPVPLPIIAGLLFAGVGGTLPAVVDQPLKLLGNAFGPMALVLVGLTLTQVRIGAQLKGALALTAIKNLALPAVVAALCWSTGLRGLPLNVMIVAAAMPMGANVFMFAQRYEVAQELVTAGMAVLTMLGLATISLVMGLLGQG